MATEERITSLPTVSNAMLDDIIYAVQGYTGPSNLGISVQETLGQIYSLFQSNVVMFNSGNPNGVLAGSTYQFCWDSLNSILYICTTTGTISTAVWKRADINSGYSTTITSASTTTLSVLSDYWQFFTGTTIQTVVMPVTSTLSPGMTWSIVNNSTGSVTIQSSGLNTITTLANGQAALVTCISSSGTSASSWNFMITSFNGGVTSITGTANQVIASSSVGAITLSTPQNIAPTSAPTFSALNLSNPLPITSGGTSSSSVITSPTANSWGGWDANKNLAANNMLEGYTTTASSAGITTLIASSTYQQFFTGTTTHTVRMPVTSSLVLGQSWLIVNNSTGIVTIQSSGGNTITAMAGSTSALVTCILTSGTTAASWNSVYNLNTAGVSSITGTPNQIIASASTGNVTLSAPQDIAVTSSPVFSALTLSNPLPITSGGTGSGAVISTPTATRWAGWDANKNLSSNSTIEGYTTTPTSGGTTVLTVGSTYQQFFTGSTTQIVTMPITSTLALGQAWLIVNNSTGIVTVQSSGGSTITSMSAGTNALVTCILTSGTTSSSWNSDYSPNGLGVTSITGTANQIIASSSTGDVTLSTAQDIAIGSSPTFAALNLTNPYIPGAGGLHSFQAFTSGTAATYTKPSGVTSILVEVVGGGGGGGGCAAAIGQTAAAGSGGAAGYCRRYFPSAAATYTYTVGPGGAGGVAGNNNGTAGTASTFDVMTSNGGAGGTGSATSAAATVAALSGNGGTASGGSVNVKGGPGGSGTAQLNSAMSGAGGGSYFQGGALSARVGAAASVNGNAGAVNSGAGGSGGVAVNTATTVSGGNGATGIIIVWEFA